MNLFRSARSRSASNPVPRLAAEQVRTALLASVIVLLATAPLHANAASGGRWEDPNCPGIRPGAAMLPATNQQFASTWGFILTGSDGHTYTLLDATNLVTPPQFGVDASYHPPFERTYSPGRGPGVADGSGRVVAHVVWYAYDNTGQFSGYGFALARVDRGHPWVSTVCGFGRPRSVDTTIDMLPVTISYYQQGGVQEQVSHTWTDVLPEGRNQPDWVIKTVPNEGGNASAPVLTGDNQAFGLISAYCCGGTPGYGDPAKNPGQDVAASGIVWRLAPLMHRAEARLRISLSLAAQPSGVAM